MYTSSRAAPASSTMNNALLRRPSLLASDSTRPGRHCARGSASFVPRASLPDHHISGSMERVGTRRRATQHNITPSATASGFSNPAPTVNVASAASLSPKTVKVGSYVVGWYVFNIIFNILNKSCLNVFPAPWFLATFQLCASATFMVALWLSGIQRRPQVSKELITALVPVAFWHTVGHVSACVAFSQVAVSFTHVVKSAEPVLSVILSQVLLKEAYPAYVWASLIPIVAGCSLAAVNEVSFAWSGFNNAMISNLGMVMRNIYSKKYLDQFKSLDGINLFALLSIISIFITLPAALYVEGFKGGVYQWGAMADAATASLGGDFVLFMRLIVGSGIFYHLYNQFSYMVLDTGMSPVSFSVANVLKRVSVVVASIVFFANPVSPMNWAGSIMALLGTGVYSAAKQKANEEKRKVYVPKTDPLEEFCADDPSADECRVYED